MIHNSDWFRGTRSDINTAVHSLRSPLHDTALQCLNTLPNAFPAEIADERSSQCPRFPPLPSIAAACSAALLPPLPPPPSSRPRQSPPAPPHCPQNTSSPSIPHSMAPTTTCSIPLTPKFAPSHISTAVTPARNMTASPNIGTFRAAAATTSTTTINPRPHSGTRTTPWAPPDSTSTPDSPASTSSAIKPKLPSTCHVAPSKCRSPSQTAASMPTAASSTPPPGNTSMDTPAPAALTP